MAMGGLRKRRRIQLVAIGAVMLVLATGLIGYAMRDGIEFFRSPSQIVLDPPREGERFRLGGLVEEGSVIRGEGESVRFVVTDGGATMPVVFAGILPDLFREGQGVVTTGSLQDGVFVANEVLARHDESYMPKEVADALKEQGLFQHGGGINPRPESQPGS
jgi:cytochrome c-type biogenesis protein CcmE